MESQIGTNLQVVRDEEDEVMADYLHRCEYDTYGDCEGRVVQVHNMTCYPNQPAIYWMCTEHADLYTSEWQERWDEYYAEIRAGLNYDCHRYDVPDSFGGDEYYDDRHDDRY